MPSNRATTADTTIERTYRTTTAGATRLDTADTIEVLGPDGRMYALGTVPSVMNGNVQYFTYNGIDSNRTITGFKTHPNPKYILFYPYDYENSGAVTAGTVTLLAIDAITGQTGPASFVAGTTTTSASLVSATPTVGRSETVPSHFGFAITAFASTGESADLMVEVHY